MSTFKVEVVAIDGVMPHPNADRLDLVKVKDWQCVTQKNKYRVGDLVIYLPIDSILAPTTESKLFPIDSKVKLSNSRIKTIKLRGAISQGMVVDPELFHEEVGEVELGDELSSVLGITKYEPPSRLNPASGKAAASKKQINPHFRKYTGIENAKNYPEVFTEGEEVSVTEKVHGTNFRAGYVPFVANTLWKKLKSWLGLAPKWEFVYGSHNVQLQNKLLYSGFYTTNVYAEAVVKYNLPQILKPGEVVYGEIYGDGIQKGYSYGCQAGERKLVLFDVRVNDEWTDTIAFRKWADERQLPFVPEIYRGPFNKENILKLRDGDSVLAPSQKVREGVIVKPLQEQTVYMGRKMLKFISDNYLLKNQDDETEAH